MRVRVRVRAEAGVKRSLQNTQKEEALGARRGSEGTET